MKLCVYMHMCVPVLLHVCTLSTVESSPPLFQLKGHLGSRFVLSKMTGTPYQSLLSFSVLHGKGRPFRHKVVRVLIGTS